MMLFCKECSKLFRSLTYILYSLLVIMMIVSQYFMEGGEKVYPPSKGDYDFGEKIVEDQDLIMSTATDALTVEFLSNRYVCYPFGFYKAVHLDNEEQEKIEKYICEITGLDSAGIAENKKSAEVSYITDGTHDYSEYEISDMPINDNMTYERFKEIMEDVDDILGGGSDYAVDGLVYKFSRVPMTYEDAVEDYNSIFKDDRVTNAYARLFSDYAGIVLAILPVFVAAALTAADRRRRMSELIYSRRSSSLRIVFTRFLALVTTMFIPVFVFMVIAFIQILIRYNGSDIDMTAMFTLPIFWLLPNIMAATATGMLVTEILSAGAAILVQFVWWFMGLMAGGTAGLSGRIGKFTFICRHNALGNKSEFLMNWDNFVFNRVFYTVISLAAVLFTVGIYELKRGGCFNGIRLFGKGSIFRRKA